MQIKRAINNTLIGIIRNSVEALHNFLKKHVLCDFFFIESTYVKAMSDYVVCTIFSGLYCNKALVENWKICVTTLNKYKVWNNHRFIHGILGFINYEPIHFYVSTILAHLLRWHCQTELS